MKKTIRIDNLRDVRVGDMLFVKGRSDGFRVAYGRPVNVANPFGPGFAYVSTDKFDHAERTIEEPEWTHPTDNDMHVYQGADGAKYLYLPSFNGDTAPWHRLPIGGYNRWDDADGMTSSYPDALPLTELKFVPSNEETR
jgi:hypothetical protein